MDLLLLVVAAMLISVLGASTSHDDAAMWRNISMRYGKWYEPPRTLQEAEKNHYKRVNDVCRTKSYHGFLYRRPQDLLSQPIYDNNGLIVGLQSAIPNHLKGFDANNRTINIPPAKMMPPFMKGGKTNKGVKLYTLTAYFKHPRLVCNPGARDAKPYKGLYIQMGDDPERDYMEIPLKLKDLSRDWKEAGCVTKMGTHYFKNLSKKLRCEDLYPVFLTYTDGKLGAFGWIFQGNPPRNNKFDLSWYHLSPSLYAFIGLDKKNVPPCMLYPEFQVNGIHIWLRPPSEQLCIKHPIHTSHPSSKTTTTIVQLQIVPGNYYIGNANSPSLAGIFVLLVISIGLHLI